MRVQVGLGTGLRALGAAAAVAMAVAMVGVTPGLAVAVPASAVVQAPSSGQRAPDLGGTVVSHGKARSASNSLDWAGFAATGSTVTSVAGSWTQPSVVCPGNKLTQSAFWVGIDGFASNDPTVQQIGTDADCAKGTKKAPGGPLYYAWFEMYPAGLVVLDPANYPVHPGDVLSASVSGTGTNYTLSISDAGSGASHWSYLATQVASTPTLGASAEWIAEAPTSCSNGRCKPLPLADFGSVSFRGATVNGLPVAMSGLSASKITMTKNKKGTVVKASTSLLDASGGGFTVNWLSI